ncbi:MAG: HD domain-containing phosphohydrolase [Anaerolineae bacterium]
MAWRAAVKIARERNGGAYAPFIVERFCQYADQLFAGIDDEPSWETVMALESSRGDWLTDEQFDTACKAMADFVDIKSTSTLNHSHEVARTAAAAASHAGLPSADVQTIRRAGWLHGIGKTGITANILEKAGSLNDREWERVRLHPYYTERILARSTALSQIGRIATLHHELLDGSGYHRGFAAAAISPAARLLAAANRYCALLDNRPYRPAAEPEAAAELLKRDVHAGRLDGDAVHCVLASAGHRVTVPESVAGLSEREIEVLRLLARGSSTKEILSR